jgi:hypothetical protein
MLRGSFEEGGSSFINGVQCYERGAIDNTATETDTTWIVKVRSVWGRYYEVVDCEKILWKHLYSNKYLQGYHTSVKATTPR